MILLSQVEGISGPPTAALADRLKDLIYGERQLRSDSDYAPQVACAKEVRNFLGIFFDHLARRWKLRYFS